jgi:hypothetical protein
MIYIEDNFYNCMDINCRNWKWDFELSQIKWDKNEKQREIFEVPGVYENQRRQTLTLALTVYVTCLKYMKLVEFDTKFTNE